MMTVKAVSKRTGVSVRTLHHYDSIGLLKPEEITGAGYRLYDDTALERLQNILFFKELQFSLKEIKAIIDSPDFDRLKALEQQIELLEMQRNHIDALISHAREIIEKGETAMEFSVFNSTDIEKYKEEVKAKWGGTEAYMEYEKKHSGEDYREKTERLMEVFAEIGGLKHCRPEDKAVQDKIADLKQFITDNYYNCTDEILKGLSLMYTEDERFRSNIDKAGGEGTAEFVRQAVRVYCGKSR